MTTARFLVCADSAVLISCKSIRMQVLNLSCDKHAGMRAIARGWSLEDLACSDRSQRSYLVSILCVLKMNKTRSVFVPRRFDSVEILTKAVEDSVQALTD